MGILNEFVKLMLVLTNHISQLKFQEYNNFNRVTEVLKKTMAAFLKVIRKKTKKIKADGVNELIAKVLEDKSTQKYGKLFEELQIKSKKLREEFELFILSSDNSWRTAESLKKMDEATFDNVLGEKPNEEELLSNSLLEESGKPDAETYFVFQPKQVQQFSGLLPQIKPGLTYTLVMDLDETLVHYEEKEGKGKFFIRPFT